MRKSDQKRDFKPVKRTSQIVFGERQHLKAVLESVVKFPGKGQESGERAKLKSMIEARTEELNRITPEWDQTMERARDPRTPAQELARIAEKASADDYLLLRTVSENPNTPGPVLSLLARHSYEAVKENVARHPNADGETLERLAADPGRSLWFLVACNASAPKALRERLRKKMEASAEAVT